MKKCPYCAEEIQDEAIFCRFCKRDLTQPVALPHRSLETINDKQRRKLAYLDRICVITSLIAGVSFLIGPSWSLTTSVVYYLIESGHTDCRNVFELANGCGPNDAFAGQMIAMSNILPLVTLGALAISGLLLLAAVFPQMKMRPPGFMWGAVAILALLESLTDLFIQGITRCSFCDAYAYYSPYYGPAMYFSLASLGLIILVLATGRLARRLPNPIRIIWILLGVGAGLTPALGYVFLSSGRLDLLVGEWGRVVFTASFGAIYTAALIRELDIDAAF